jgi:hypothetical protein
VKLSYTRKIPSQVENTLTLALFHGVFVEMLCISLCKYLWEKSGKSDNPRGRQNLTCPQNGRLNKKLSPEKKYFRTVSFFEMFTRVLSRSLHKKKTQAEACV